MVVHPVQREGNVLQAGYVSECQYDCIHLARKGDTFDCFPIGQLCSAFPVQNVEECDCGPANHLKESDNVQANLLCVTRKDQGLLLTSQDAVTNTQKTILQKRHKPNGAKKLTTEDKLSLSLIRQANKWSTSQGLCCVMLTCRKT